MLFLEVVILLSLNKKLRKQNSNRGAISDRMARVEACCGDDNGLRTWFKL